MRTLIRAVFVLILVAVVGFLAMGYWPAGLSLQKAGTESPSSGAGTSGRIDTERVRERAADIGEKAAIATQKIQESVTRGRADDQDQGEDGPRRHPQGAGD